MAPGDGVAPTPDASLGSRPRTRGNSLHEDQGIAGASARREYERRRAKDEASIRDGWGRFGGIAVALTPERQSTRAWGTGASGEERVGQRLDALASDSLRVLHDRRIPGTRANIDHIVVTSHAVWVIDAKKYKGRPSLEVNGGLFRPRVEKLFVAGLDKSKLVEGVEWQVERVSNAVGGLPVVGVLCFVEAEWPLIGGSFSVRDVEVLWPKKLVARLSASSTGPVDVDDAAALLAGRFRVA